MITPRPTATDTTVTAQPLATTDGSVTAAPGRTATFDPLSLTPTAYYKDPDFSTAAVGDLWLATDFGDDVSAETGTDSAFRTATAGAPTCDFAGSSGANLSLTNTVPLSTFGGGAASDRCYVAVLDLAAVTPTDATNLYVDAMLVDDGPDAKVYTGLGFYKSGTDVIAFFYQFDGAIKAATINLGTVAPGTRLVVQGWKTGGKLYVRVDGTESAVAGAGVAAGNVGDTSGKLRVHRRTDCTLRRVLTFDRALTLSERDDVHAWGAAL